MPTSPDHVAVRLDAEIIARLDALIPTLSNEWLHAKRADVLRKVILSGLEALEKQHRLPVPAAPRSAPRLRRVGARRHG